jgi:RimJ/RimL family protein N-acetyltransferase
VQLTSERLLLRELEEGDWQTLYEFEREPETRRYNPDALPSPLSFQLNIQALSGQQRDTPRQSFYFGIVLKADGRLIGSCYIAIRDAAARQAEIGYMLGVTYWNKGYATEAARRLLDFGFKDLRMHRIFASQVISVNTASVSVLEKLGMRREAHLRQSHWFHGRWWDYTSMRFWNTKGGT